MGEVVKGMFGRGYGTSGVGQAEAPSQVVAPPTEQTAVRATGSPGVAPAVVLRDLEAMLADVRTAANRLINLPPPGVVPVELKSQLLSQYAELEARVRAAGDKIASGAVFDQTVMDEVHALQQAAGQYIGTVENTLRSVGVVSGPARKGQRNWVLYGLLAVGLGIAGYAGYRAYKHTGPAASKRPIKRTGARASRKALAD